MPLARLELRNEYGLGDPELYQNAASGKEGTGAEAILHGIAVSGLVGILRQLGDVAEFGAEIFHDLHEQLMITSARGHKMLSRIKRMEDAIPSIEDDIHRKGSYIDLAYETGSDWHTDLRFMDSHISCDDLPQFIMDSYEECRDPPRLYLLDKYDRAGNGACLKRYSDPSYFKRAWATSEPEKTQQIQKEKKLVEIKRKYSRLREVQDPISTSQCNSLESSSRFAPLSNDDQSFSAENSSVSEMRLKSEVISGPQLLNIANMLNCTGQVSETNHVLIPNAPEYDRSSVSNVQNKPDHIGASQLHNDELVFDVDDDSQYDFFHWKSTSRSPSVIWEEKSELMKAADRKFFDDTQDSMRLFVNSESSKVQEPTRTISLNQTKPFPIISDLPRSCDQNQFEEANEADNYVDALNTLESEGETDSECQAKCMQSLSKMEDEKNESGVASMTQYYGNSNIEVAMSLNDSSNKYRLPSDTQEAGLSPGSPYDGSQLFENTVIAMSRTNAFQGTDDDQHSWSIDAKSETVLSNETTAETSQIETTPPISISNIPSSKLWTNGNLLGLEPSKPLDVSLPNRTEEWTQSSSVNNDVKSDKQNMSNGQISKQLNSIGKVPGSRESLSLADQRILNSNPFLSRKYLVEENSSIKHSSTYICHDDDGFDIQQNFQEQSEALSFSEREGSQVASPNLLITSVSQVHQTTKSASSKESEPCSAFSAASPSMDSMQNSECSSHRFSGLPQRNLVQCLHVKPSDTYAKSSTQYERMNDDYNQSEEKPLVYNQRKRLNGVASQTFSEQNLASRKFHEQSLINKTDYGSLEKSVSSGSHYSQNSSPPLEHIKISFHPMNSLESSNLKLELPDGCITERIDGNVSPSFRLFSGCTLPTHCASESDDDTFCKSYPYSTEDLLSARSDSNSELWEQDDYSGSKTNELSDDLRRISSSTASISSYSGFEQMNLVNQEIGLKDICTGNDTNSFQPCYPTNIPTFESLVNQDVRYDSLSISPENATTLTPTELPPPPPLPPIQWRLVRPSYEIASEDNYSNIAQMVNHFEEPQNQKPAAPTEIVNIIRWPLSLAEDGQCKNMHDNRKLDSLLQTHELGSKEQSHHQIRNTEIQHKLKPYEESKSQIASSEGADEKDLLHQIRAKTFNLRRTATSRPNFVTQPTTNDRVTAILEKANAIRQACASSDEDDDDDDWSDG